MRKMTNDMNLCSTNQDMQLNNNPLQKLNVQKVSSGYAINSNNDRNTMQSSFIFAKYNAPKNTKMIQLETDKDCNFCLALPYDTRAIQDPDFNAVGDVIIYHPTNNTSIITKNNGDVIIKTETQKILISNNGEFNIEANGSNITIESSGSVSLKRGTTEITITQNNKIKLTNQINSFYTMWNALTTSRVAFYNALSTALSLGTYNAFRNNLNPQITGFIATENNVLAQFNNLFEV